jgi:hypothetical protein
MMRFFCHSQVHVHLFRRLIAITAVFVLAVLIIADPAYVRGQDKPAGNSGAVQIAKAVGTIKAIQPDMITIAAESGAEVTAKLSSSTKILRVPPGEKDLKNATALQQQDLQTGDRVLVRGQAAKGGEHAIMALSLIVMKQADVTAKHQHDLEDWQKRGVDGVVTAVDAGAGVIAISPGRIGPNKSIAIHVAKNTVLRRYDPDSVQFDDAKSAPVDQIKVGDQLRALGTRSADGSEVAAEEVVSGSFRNIAGTIKAIDAASNTMTVQDAISKSSVTVKIAPDSQLQKLPAEMAQRIAMRLKSSAAGASPGQSSPGQGNGASQSASSVSTVSHNPGGAGGNGPPDLQRMLSRVPAIKLADLQKGDAVVILATSGGNSDAVTTIKLLAGVEAILTASPSQSASSLLSPWSLGAGGEGEAAQ